MLAIAMYQFLFLACLPDTNAPNALGNSDHPLLDIEWPIKIGIWAQAAHTHIHTIHCSKYARFYYWAGDVISWCGLFLTSDKS